MKITYWIAGLLIVLTVLINLTRPSEPTSVANFPLQSSVIEKKLFYDWPRAFELIDEITAKYGRSIWDEPQKIPKPLLEEIKSSHVWQGYLPQILDHSANDAPWFEKISKGEVWRLFTPALLHIELYHLAFNLFWLIVLGRLLEERMGAWKYLLITLIFGIGSNTAQYLMSGMFFLGYSGVVCGLFGFIYVNRKSIPYPLPNSLFTATFIFIFGMAALEAGSILLRSSYSFSIANTAHISGLLLGLITARFFQHEQA